jgi:FtsP/CotA-like multicopper oxidase with cupredoxin domain
MLIILRGDWILFKVTNDLTDEGTSLHAHGLFQMETSWYDGYVTRVCINKCNLY